MINEASMHIEKKEVTIRDLVEGFEDNKENGVCGYGKKLDIRPPYQREFIYNDKQKQAVIDTVINGYPLNVMYWADRSDGTYEVIDGQQRTMSICSFYNNEFSFKERIFDNFQNDEKEKFLNYPLFVYTCSGTDSEKLQWFETINIAGAELTAQELRNAVYAGKWVMDAKAYFSKTECPATEFSKYLSGRMNRQEYLETAITWICGSSKPADIKDYMSHHQKDPDASELWNNFQCVMNWVQAKFNYRKEMKGLDWGFIYNKYKDNKNLDKAELEKKIGNLMKDSEVQKKSGIYEYVLDGDEHHLGLRTFDDNIKREVYERQGGHCKNTNCPQGKEHIFQIEEMEADHITPWAKGGKTVAENCQMLCMECNRRKSDN